MLNNILGKVTKPQHASVHKVSRVKNLEGGHICPPGSDRVKSVNPALPCLRYDSM